MRTRLLLLAILAGVGLGSEPDHIRDYRTHEPPDRNVLFAMAITPEQDVLSWVAKADGNWRLTRIRGWLGKSPEEQTVNVPGWTRSMGDRTSLWAEVYVTADGAYALCFVDDLLSFVDLRRFAVLGTVHLSDLGLRDSPMVHPAGYLVSQALTSNPLDDSGHPHLEAITLGTDGMPVPGTPWLHQTKEFRLFSVPDLAFQGKCDYTERYRGGDDWTAQDAVDGKPGGCTELLARLKIHGSLRDFVATIINPAEPNRRRLHGECEAERTTRDGRFRVQSCETHHESFLTGNMVFGALWENVISVRTGRPAGQIHETTHDTVKTRLAEIAGKDYFLILEGGTKLKVYELKE